MASKQWKWIVSILMLGTIMAALKVIFFDYTMDEEYQIMMSYRNLEGDHLFKEMWEPHQTSAFLCTGLMWLYKMVTGTYTGVMIYLRVCTVGIQALICWYLCRVLRGFLDREYAFLCGLIYFNIVPKIIQIPEFSNMQLWFFTLLVLPLIQYYTLEKTERKKKWYLLVVAGISMSLEVLSYPSCLILFPFFAGYLFISSGKSEDYAEQNEIREGKKGFDRVSAWRDSLIFVGTCGICGILWLAAVLRTVSMEEFLRNLQYILNYDLTHELSGATAGKGIGILKSIIGGVGFFALSGLLSLPVFCWIWIKRKRKQSGTAKGGY